MFSSRWPKGRYLLLNWIIMINMRIKFVWPLIFCTAVSVFTVGASPVENAFLGRGVAKIENDDVSEARRRAFVDAQEKVLISAVSMYLPLEDMAEYFIMLKKLFFDHPDIYLERFKIVREQVLYDRYQVCVQGTVQQDLLRQDLESMGVLASAREKTKVLLMVAETGLSESVPRLWWHSDSERSAAGGEVQKQLSVYFRDSGFFIIDPAGKPLPVPAAPLDLDPDAASEKIAAFANEFGADIVIIGRSELVRTENRRLTTVENVQCGISARIINVRDASVLVQAAAYKLGMHVDTVSAARAAIDKACRHLSAQVANKIFLKLRNLNNYMFKLSMPEGSRVEDVEKWFSALNGIAPDVVAGTIENSGDIWNVTVNSTFKRADIIQKLLQFGIDGYSSEIVSADKNVLEIKVTPVARHLP